MSLCDSHCHFFSAQLFRTLGRETDLDENADTLLPAQLGWEPPGNDADLADRWVSELDRHSVDRAMLIASVPGDELSVAAATARHPRRIAGAFMFNPAAPDAEARLERAFAERGLRMVCLFPAMTHVPLDDPRTEAVFAAAERHGRAVFVHCGLLSLGIRRKLGLPSRFDLRLGDPLAAGAMAARHLGAPVVIPHFGAGLFREALMAADASPNVLLDTSSSNGWTRFHPGLTLRDAMARALDIVGPRRLLFGTDSSFFPRGWQHAIYETQRGILKELGVDSEAQALVFGGNFNRVFAGIQP